MQRAGLVPASEASGEAVSSLSPPAVQHSHAPEAESPDAAASQPGASERGAQPPGVLKAAPGVHVAASERSASVSALSNEAMPALGLSNGQPAGAEEGGDNLAYAEALERALAIGEAAYIQLA